MEYTSCCNIITVNVGVNNSIVTASGQSLSSILKSLSSRKKCLGGSINTLITYFLNMLLSIIWGKGQ